MEPVEPWPLFNVNAAPQIRPIKRWRPGKKPKSPEKKKKRSVSKILPSNWSKKTHAYVKMVTQGKGAPCQIWSLTQKKQLLSGLKRYSHQDWDSLNKCVPSKTPKEVREYVQFLRGSTSYKTKAGEEVKLSWAPVESWLDMCMEMIHYEQTDLSAILSRVFSIIGHFSELPTPRNTSLEPDYGKLYHFIAAVMDEDLSLPDLTPLECAVMVDLMQGLSDKLRVSDTSLQRKVLCWKYKMLNHKFNFGDVKGTLERIRKALTNDFSDLQKDGHRSVSELPSFRSGDNSNSASSTAQASTSGAGRGRGTKPGDKGRGSTSQGGGDTEGEEEEGDEDEDRHEDVVMTAEDVADLQDASPQRRGRRRRGEGGPWSKQLEKPRLYSMNPFCVPIRLLRLKPLLDSARPFAALSTPTPTSTPSTSSAHPSSTSPAAASTSGGVGAGLSSSEAVGSPSTSSGALLPETPAVIRLRGASLDVIRDQIQFQASEAQVARSIRNVAGIYNPAPVRKYQAAAGKEAAGKVKVSELTLAAMRSTLSQRSRYAGAVSSDSPPTPSPSPSTSSAAAGRGRVGVTVPGPTLSTTTATSSAAGPGQSRRAVTTPALSTALRTATSSAPGTIQSHPSVPAESSLSTTHPTTTTTASTAEGDSGGKKGGSAAPGLGNGPPGSVQMFRLVTLANGEAALMPLLKPEIFEPSYFRSPLRAPVAGRSVSVGTTDVEGRQVAQEKGKSGSAPALKRLAPNGTPPPPLVSQRSASSQIVGRPRSGLRRRSASQTNRQRSRSKPDSESHDDDDDNDDDDDGGVHESDTEEASSSDESLKRSRSRRKRKASSSDGGASTKVPKSTATKAQRAKRSSTDRQRNKSGEETGSREKIVPASGEEMGSQDKLVSASDTAAAIVSNAEDEEDSAAMTGGKAKGLSSAPNASSSDASAGVGDVNVARTSTRRRHMEQIDMTADDDMGADMSDEGDIGAVLSQPSPPPPQKTHVGSKADTRPAKQISRSNSKSRTDGESHDEEGAGEPDSVPQRRESSAGPSGRRTSVRQVVSAQPDAQRSSTDPQAVERLERAQLLSLLDSARQEPVKSGRPTQDSAIQETSQNKKQQHLSSRQGSARPEPAKSKPTLPSSDAARDAAIAAAQMRRLSGLKPPQRRRSREAERETWSRPKAQIPAVPRTRTKLFRPPVPTTYQEIIVRPPPDLVLACQNQAEASPDTLADPSTTPTPRGGVKASKSKSKSKSLDQPEATVTVSGGPSSKETVGSARPQASSPSPAKRATVVRRRSYNGPSRQSQADWSVAADTDGDPADQGADGKGVNPSSEDGGSPTMLLKAPSKTYGRAPGKLARRSVESPQQAVIASSSSQETAAATGRGPTTPVGIARQTPQTGAVGSQGAQPAPTSPSPALPSVVVVKTVQPRRQAGIVFRAVKSVAKTPQVVNAQEKTNVSSSTYSLLTPPQAVTLTGVQKSPQSTSGVQKMLQSISGVHKTPQSTSDIPKNPQSTSGVQKTPQSTPLTPVSQAKGPKPTFKAILAQVASPHGSSKAGSSAAKTSAAPMSSSPSSSPSSSSLSPSPTKKLRLTKKFLSKQVFVETGQKKAAEASGVKKRRSLKTSEDKGKAAEVLARRDLSGANVEYVTMDAAMARLQRSLSDTDRRKKQKAAADRKATAAVPVTLKDTEFTSFSI